MLGTIRYVCWERFIVAANGKKLTSFEKAKGYGFVRVAGTDGKDDQDVFVHKTRVEHCRNAMTEGSVLSFDVEVTDKGAEARNIVVVTAVERKPRAEVPPNGLHAGGLAPGTTEDDLANLFKDFETTHVEVVAPRFGANFAHACICLANSEDMEKAIAALDKTVLNGNEIFVQVRRSGKKNRKKKKKKRFVSYFFHPNSRAIILTLE